MRVFVSEYVSGGGWPEEDVPASLLAEGRAMLQAAAEDFSRVAGCSVVTTCDARFVTGDSSREQPTSRQLRTPENVEVIAVGDPGEERDVFCTLVRDCDVTFVVAPETGGALAERRRLVDAHGGRFLGASLEAIELCGDKLRLARQLERDGIRTIPMCKRLHAEMGPDPFSALVVKPRFGAGSQDTYLVRSLDELEAALVGVAEPIVQPYLSGRNISVGAIAGRDGRVEVFPPGEQRLSADGRFRYLGGRIPARDVDRGAVEGLVKRACRSLSGLTGYFGVDLIVPDGGCSVPTTLRAVPAPSIRGAGFASRCIPGQPVIVEINPRLTTGYLGYRRLARRNLAERLLRDPPAGGPIEWKDKTVEFSPEGGRELSGR